MIFKSEPFLGKLTEFYAFLVKKTINNPGATVNTGAIVLFINRMLNCYYPVVPEPSHLPVFVNSYYCGRSF